MEKFIRIVFSPGVRTLGAIGLAILLTLAFFFPKDQKKENPGGSEAKSEQPKGGPPNPIVKSEGGPTETGNQKGTKSPGDLRPQSEKKEKNNEYPGWERARYLTFFDLNLPYPAEKNGGMANLTEPRKSTWGYYHSLGLGLLIFVGVCIHKIYKIREDEENELLTEALTPPDLLEAVKLFSPYFIWIQTPRKYRRFANKLRLNYGRLAKILNQEKHAAMPNQLLKISLLLEIAEKTFPIKTIPDLVKIFDLVKFPSTPGDAEYEAQTGSGKYFQEIIDNRGKKENKKIELTISQYKSKVKQLIYMPGTQPKSNPDSEFRYLIEAIDPTIFDLLIKWETKMEISEKLTSTPVQNL